MASESTPAVDRVLARTTMPNLVDCWIWNGAINHGGYGIVQVGRGIGTDRTHRVVYEALVGPIPEGMTLDHLCFNPACVNPAHLDLVTRSENTKRQWAAGHADPGRSQREKTHCKRGHEFTPENTKVSNGRRHCRACRRLRSRARRRFPD